VNQPPVGDGQWRLYNIITDPGETVDLSGTEPQRFQRMLSNYEQYRRDNKVVPVPQGYNQARQMLLNILMKGRDNMIALLLTLVLLLPFYVAHKMGRANRV
jgi:arylsulfatase/uncharacterized sulfatase